MRYFIITSGLALITACGGQDVSEAGKDTPTASQGAAPPTSQTKAERGGILLRVTAMNTDSRANGLLTDCLIDFEVHNRTGDRIKRLNMPLSAETSDEFDAAVAGAVHDQSIYTRDIPKGRSSITERIASKSCEGLTAINISGEECSTDDGPCEPNIVTVEGGDFLTITKS